MHPHFMANLFGLQQIPGRLLADGEIEAVFWFLVVAVLLVPAAFIVMWLRKWAKGGEDDDSTGGVFVLSDLRQLLKQGKITPEEFERLKAEIVASAKRTAEQPPKGPGGTADSASEDLPPFDPPGGNSGSPEKPPKP